MKIAMLNKILIKLGIIFVIVFVYVYMTSSAYANTTANNRNDIFSLLSQLEATNSITGLEVWVNEKSKEPSVNIGDTVSISMRSNEPAFYTLVYIDSKGDTSVIRPDGGTTDRSAVNQLVYPALNDECNTIASDSLCTYASEQLTQVEPVGEDTLYLIASQREVPLDVLGISPGDNFRHVGRAIEDVKNLVANLNAQSVINPMSMVTFTYAVEADDTQYGTRSIRRKVKELDQDLSLDFNNVKFDYKSADLTEHGKKELDVLGSALVGIQEENGDIPPVKFIGHTDSIASSDYNMNLSKLRANAAKEYLEEEYGLPSQYISTKGAGESNPIGSNDTEAGRALNRRVELQILSNQ